MSEKNAYQNHLGYLLADAYRFFRRTFEQRLDEYSITLAQARTLVSVSCHQGIRQVELASLLEIQPITLARLIDQLVEIGLVERRADPGDRRAYQLYLTRTAAPYLSTIERVADAIRAEALQGVNEQQSTNMMQVLQKVRCNLAAGLRVSQEDDVKQIGSKPGGNP